MFGPRPAGFWSKRTGRDSYHHLVPGRRYRVAMEFRDNDGQLHPVDESWWFRGASFNAYHDGLSLFVSLDGESEWNIPLLALPGAQGPVVDALDRYLVEEGPAGGGAG